MHGAGLVPVHVFDLRRPLPAFVGEIEPEPPDPLRVAARQCVLDGRLPLDVGQLIGHVVQISLAENSPASEQIQRSKFGHRRCADVA